VGRYIHFMEENKEVVKRRTQAAIHAATLRHMEHEPLHDGWEAQHTEAIEAAVRLLEREAEQAYHPIVAAGGMYTTERTYRLNAIQGCSRGLFTRADLEKAYDLGWEDGHPAKTLDECAHPPPADKQYIPADLPSTGDWVDIPRMGEWAELPNMRDWAPARFPESPESPDDENRQSTNSGRR
jgi:hypothetical protein